MENFFAKNLKYLREKNQLFQEDLAKVLGVELGTISHWENKRREPNMGMITKIADYFNVRDDLIFKDLSLDKENSEIDNILFSKTKDLSKEDKEAVLNIINAIHKNIDKNN